MSQKNQQNQPEEEENLTKHARNLRLAISLVLTIVTIFQHYYVKNETTKERKMFNKKTQNKFISSA